MQIKEGMLPYLDLEAEFAVNIARAFWFIEKQTPSPVKSRKTHATDSKAV